MNHHKKLWLNGTIFTLNKNNNYAEAMVTIDNKIIFVGNNELAMKVASSDTEIFDFEKRLVLPGFIDSHVHFITGGLSLTQVNLSNCSSKDEFTSAIKKYMEQNTKEWVLGGNWDHHQFDDGHLPNKSWVDPLTEDTPLFLTRIDLHTALVNSKALELANINKDTPNPKGGKIYKDEETGEPTGILVDSAIQLVTDLIPPPTEEDYSAAFKAAVKEAEKEGITGVHDITEKNFLHYYQDAYKENRLRTRINSIQPISHVDSFVKLGINNAFGNERLKIGSLKAFADGSLGSETAWFFEPYTNNPSTNGLPTDIMNTGKFKEWAINADRNHLQLVVHAIGDKAVSDVLDIFEEIVNTNPKWDRRFRIEHVQHIKEKDIARMKALNVIASMQPSQLYDDGAWAESKVGKARLKGTHAVKTLLENGVKVCLGSDWPVTPLDVIHGIDIAVNRKTKDGKNPDGWIPEEKISVAEAIKAYTIDAAYASFEENIKGSLETGKLADFIVLDKNILEIDPSEIKDVNIDLTVMNGEKVYIG